MNRVYRTLFSIVLGLVITNLPNNSLATIEDTSSLHETDVELPDGPGNTPPDDTGPEGNPDYIPPEYAGPEGNPDYIPPGDTGPEGNPDYIPPGDTGPEGNPDYIPPEYAGPDYPEADPDICYEYDSYYSVVFHFYTVDMVVLDYFIQEEETEEEDSYSDFFN